MNCIYSLIPMAKEKPYSVGIARLCPLVEPELSSIKISVRG